MVLSFRFFTGDPEFVAVGVYSGHMGSKRQRNPQRSLNCLQKDRFPIGELASKRATLRAELLSKSKELCGLQKQIQRLKNNVSFKFYLFVVFGETLYNKKLVPLILKHCHDKPKSP